MTRQLVLLLLLILPFQVTAKVLSSSANGFTLEIEREVTVAQGEVYQQFLKISDWWISDHTYFGQAKNLSISPQSNGCFCEIDGDKQVLHMTVTYVDPDKEIRMVGGLGPLQMMGVSGGMSWRFEALEANRTRIIQRYQVNGSIEGGVDKLAAIVDKVQTQQQDSLVARLKMSQK